MKPISLFIALVLVLRLGAIVPAASYTFVDPCTPFVMINAVDEKHGCYLFTAFNGILPGQTQGTYSWQFGNGASATGSCVAFCFDPKTVATVHTGTVTYNESMCGAPNAMRIFTVMVPAIPNSSCIVVSPEVLQSAESVTVLGGIAIPEIMRSFNYGDGPGYDNDPHHTYSGCGPFVITIKSWDMNLPDAVCFAFHAVNIACKEFTTGIKEERADVANAFPNPCRDKLFIETKKTPERITVTDLLGKTRSLDFKGEGQRTVLDTEDFSHGIFFVKIEYLDRSADVFKIMKD